MATTTTTTATIPASLIPTIPATTLTAALPSVSQAAQQFVQPVQAFAQNAVQQGQAFVHNAGTAIHNQLRPFVTGLENATDYEVQRLSTHISNTATNVVTNVVNKYKWFAWALMALAALAFLFALLAFINTHRIAQAIGLNGDKHDKSMSGCEVDACGNPTDKKGKSCTTAAAPMVPAINPAVLAAMQSSACAPTSIPPRNAHLCSRMRKPALDIGLQGRVPRFGTLRVLVFFARKVFRSNDE